MIHKSVHFQPRVEQPLAITFPQAIGNSTNPARLQPWNGRDIVVTQKNTTNVTISPEIHTGTKTSSLFRDIAQTVIAGTIGALGIALGAISIKTGQIDHIQKSITHMTRLFQNIV